MIRKLVVRSGQLEFWHMAAYTFVRGHRARLRAGFSGTAVTGLAFCVVIYRSVAHLVVRVMARQAADSRVVRIVAPAPRQPIGLKANVRYAQITLQRNFFPRPVTLSAEV